jgi:hypothetical protein
MGSGNLTHATLRSSSLLSTEIQADIFYAFEEVNINDIYKHISNVESMHSPKLQD